MHFTAFASLELFVREDDLLRSIGAAEYPTAGVRRPVLVVDLCKRPVAELREELKSRVMQETNYLKFSLLRTR